MDDQEPQHAWSVMARPDQPLIGVYMATNGHEQIMYFLDEAEADQVLRQQERRQPIKLAGVWSDLDGDAMLAELDRLRHGSVPTPPIMSL